MAAIIIATTGCTGDPSISVLPSSDSFSQEGNEITAKMDIIWVIDNSGSMAGEQADLRNNFNSFMRDFVGKGYDFKMAVISTDAWYTEKGDRFDQSGPYTDFTSTGGQQCPNLAIISSKFLDGNLTNDTRSMYPVISSDDATIEFKVDPPYAANNVIDIFATNSNLGIKGCGAESGLRSIEVALNDSGNAGFLREDAHLAVILVSDELDQILDANNSIILNPTPVSYYHDFLTDKASADRGYSFHSIVRLEDDACGATYTAGHSYKELSDLSDGVKASICGDFAASLSEIAQSIIETTVEFKLTDVPKTTDGAGFVVSVKNVGETEFRTILKVQRMAGATIQSATASYSTEQRFLDKTPKSTFFMTQTAYNRA